MAIQTGVGIQLGGGGGVGALPIAIRSTDSLPAVFVDIAARNAYYLANPDDIAAGTDLANRQAAVAIGPNDGNPVGVTASFIRNQANDDWVPIATNFVGDTGATGPAGQNGDPLSFASIAARDTFFADNANLPFW